MRRLSKILLMSMLVYGAYMYSLFGGTVTNTSDYVYTGRVSFTQTIIGTNVYSENSGMVGGYTAPELVSIGATYYVWGSTNGPFTNSKLATLSSPVGKSVWTSSVDNVTNGQILGYASIKSDERPRVLQTVLSELDLVIERNGPAGDTRQMRPQYRVYESNGSTLVQTFYGEARPVPTTKGTVTFHTSITNDVIITDFNRYIVVCFELTGSWSGTEDLKVYSQDGELTYFSLSGGSGVYVSQSEFSGVTANTSNWNNATARLDLVEANTSNWNRATNLSVTTWKYWTNLISMTGASLNYLYPLSTNSCEIPHIYSWANNTNACDFSGTIWLWGKNTYLPDENVNRFATRFQVTRFTNVVAANATQLVVLDASSFNNDDIIAIYSDLGATGTNNPTEWNVVTNRSSNTLMLRSGVTNNYTSTSGRVHRVVRFDGLDWYYNAGLSNALPMSLEFTTAITNNIAVKVMEIDN